MLNFNNAETLSISHQYEYLGGGNLFNHRVLRNISLKGCTTGVSYSGIWINLENFIPTDQYQEITLNNSYSLGSGIIKSINFEPGNDLFYKNYVAELQFLASGDLNNILSGGTYYDGINFQDATHIREFSEDFSYEKINDVEFSFSRNCSIGVTSGGLYDPAVLASGIVKNIFSTDPAIAVLQNQLPTWNPGSGLGDHFGHRNYQETHDKINHSYSFSESFTYTTGNKKYINNNSLSYSIDQNGSVNVQNRGTIRGLCIPLYENAQVGLNEVLSQTDYQVANFYTGYTQDMFNVNLSPSSLRLVEKGITSDNSEGTINYNLSYSDGDEYLTGCFHTYSESISKSDQNIFTISREGNIQGLGLRTQKFSNATNCWRNNISGQIPAQVTATYNNIAEDKIFPQLHESSKSFSFSQFNGTISYSWVYTDDPSLPNSTKIQKQEYNWSLGRPTPLTNRFPVINYGEIAQETQHGKIGDISFTSTLVGKGRRAIGDYIEHATGIILTNMTGDTHSGVLQSVSYSYTPNTKNFRFSSSWQFDNNKEYLDHSINLE